jgi:hypothetical protein
LLEREKTSEEIKKCKKEDRETKQTNKEGREQREGGTKQMTNKEMKKGRGRQNK